MLQLNEQNKFIYRQINAQFDYVTLIAQNEIQINFARLLHTFKIIFWQPNIFFSPLILCSIWIRFDFFFTFMHINGQF